MEITQSAGGIVLNSRGEVALVRNKPEGLWFFPKGRVDEGETLENTAAREIEEEAGITDLEYIDTLPSYQRPHILKDDSYEGEQVKEIHMFLYATRQEELTPSLEITDATWIPLAHVAGSLADSKDKVWFMSVYPRVREALQRD